MRIYVVPALVVWLEFELVARDLQVGERLKAEVLFLGQRSRGKHMTFLTTCKIDDDMSPSNGVIVVDGTAMARIE